MRHSTARCSSSQASHLSGPVSRAVPKDKSPPDESDSGRPGMRPSRSIAPAQMLPRRTERSPPAFVLRLSRACATRALRERGSAAGWPSAQPVRGAARGGSLEHPCLLNRINYGPSIKPPKSCADRQSHCGPVHTIGARHGLDAQDANVRPCRSHARASCRMIDRRTDFDTSDVPAPASACMQRCAKGRISRGRAASWDPS